MVLQCRSPSVRRNMVTCESIPADAEICEHELLVVNLDVGLAGIVPVAAANEDEAISLFERANPACVVISALPPES